MARHVQWMALFVGVGVVLMMLNFMFTSESVELEYSALLPPSIRGTANTKTKFATSLYRLTQDAIKEKRGIVLPLFDGISTLGISLIQELRALGVQLPVEVPHCGDLKPKVRDLIMRKDPLVRVYDVCDLAARARTEQGRPLFCKNLLTCHRKFRSFDIKLIAMAFSAYEEIMLLDADTLFFKDPTALWELDRYKNTGTLFFHDRISCETTFLAELVSSTSSVTKFHRFMAQFDASPYRALDAIPQWHASSGPAASARARRSPIALPFTPSDFLLTSHTWNRRAGHQMDSSLVLWNKLRQPRATTILASFASLNGAGRPPSYGDKELFFISCELAETAYAFADFGVGSIGSDRKDDTLSAGKSILCGDAIHYFPEASDAALGSPEGAPTLYINSDNIVNWNVRQDSLYRSKARPAEYYAGAFLDRQLPQECPFDVTVMKLTKEERKAILDRQMLVQLVEAWKRGNEDHTPQR